MNHKELNVGFSRLLIIVFSILWFQNSQAATVLYLDSEPGDYIGQGQQQSLTDADGVFTISSNAVNHVGIRFSSASQRWSLDFAELEGERIEVDSYEEATRYPFQSPRKPGLSVSGNSRGCNQLTGRFTVHEAVYDSNGNLQQLASDFEQHCEGGTPALRGAVRINSNIPVILDNPAAAAGNDKFARQEQTVILDGSNSTGGNGAIVSYQWRQLSGPVTSLQNDQAALANFVAPAVRLGGELLEFELEVMNSNGLSHSNSILVFVANKSDPQTFLTMNSEAGDYIGQGQQYFIDENDAVFGITSPNMDEVHIDVNNGDHWNVDFEAPQGTSLQLGAYEGATRWPFQNAVNPGLNISGDGRGCNTLTGRFDVVQIKRNLMADVDAYSAEFEQHCEGGVPALFGEVRYNYVDPSVPNADAGINQSVNEGETVILDARNSSDSDGNIVSYEWTQISGISVTLSDPTSIQPEFIASTLSGPAPENLTFEVLITDDLGFQSADSVVVTVEPVNAAVSPGTNNPVEASPSIVGGGGVMSPVWIIMILIGYMMRAVRTMPR